MKKTVSIIGGGTSGLMLAAYLDMDKYEVTIYDKKGALGRKFLVAGAGGFNLTHGEPLAKLKERYTPTSFLDSALDHYSNADFRAWLEELDIPTFEGSSNRVFPKPGIKPVEVLKQIQSYLKERGVKFALKKAFTKWDNDSALVFIDKDKVKTDYTVFALGGASWKVTGSDGSWLKLFQTKGIDTVPFKASNCAYQIKWDEKFLQKHEGRPLKNIAISLDNQIQTGEAVITKFGIEGNAIYGLSPKIQTRLDLIDEAVVHIDFKPTLSLETLVKKISDSKYNTTKTLKEHIKLSKVQLDIVKYGLTKEEYLEIPTLAKFIKKFPLKITGSASIDEAISTTGGISLDAVDANYEFKNLKNNFCVGEMLDWNAPTGGYLIQACASMGAYLAHQLNNK